jgi:hypothetical protein
MQKKDLLSVVHISGARQHHATERYIISSTLQWCQAASCNRKIHYKLSTSVAPSSIMQ